MATLWPWIAVAGLGALHGLNPANGWMFAAAWGVRAQDGSQARRALLPIGIGHVASVAIVACAFARGLSMDHTLFQGLAGALLVGVALFHLMHRTEPRAPMARQAGYAGVALWSFLMATVHGAGMMMVPALASMCMAGNPAREITASGSMVMGLGAVGVHMVAMLVTTGVVASGVCRGVAMHPRLLSGTAQRLVWSATLATTGLLLMALR